MKKIFIAVTALFLSAAAFAQSPEKMSYQAVIRNSSNSLVANSPVGMKISILQGSATGSVVYSETQVINTNSNGLVSLSIGDGSVVSGIFASIDWSSGLYFIKTETDPAGGTNYSITGTSRLMSVPYALYAKTSGSSTPGPQGEPGLNGTNGNNGTNGADGKTILNGTSDPLAATGTNGDFYLNTATNMIFGPKASGTWPAGVSIIGAQGTPGINGNNGTPGTNGSQGTNGTNGQNSLAKTATEPAGANCATGGVKIEYGLDANGNGTLDATEINASLTRYVCNGAAGSAGTGVPTGGTAGQVLSKIDATNYNTQWVTPTGAKLELIADKTGGTGETVPTAVSAPVTVVFNNVSTAPVLGAYNSSTGEYTVGSAGVYMVQARVHGGDASPTNNTVSYCLNLQINNAAWGTTTGGIIYGVYTPLNVYTPVNTKARGEFVSYVKLNAGDVIKIITHGTNSSTAPQNIIPDAGCNMMIMRM